MTQIQTKLGDHWTVIGATGTGKTYWNDSLIRTFAGATRGFVPIYILDTKCPIVRPEKSDFRAFMRRGIGRRHTGNSIPPVIRPRGRDFVSIWTPEDDDPELFDEFFRRIYKEAAPSMVVIDELSSVTSEAGRAGRYLNILWKQGRGLDISVNALTQSPAFIPQSLLRQAMHVVRFRLNDEYDAKKLTKVMGRAVEEEPAHEHGFWYRNVTIPVKKQPAAYYSDMREFFGT